MTMQRTNTGLFFWTIIFLFLGQGLWGQGWRKTYDLGGKDFSRTLIVTDDGGYQMFGSKLLRTNSTGDTLWSADFPENSEYGKWPGNTKAIQTQDGQFVTISSNNEGTSRMYLTNFEQNGSLNWFVEHPIPGKNAIGQSLTATLDGGFAFLTYYNDTSCTCWKTVLIKTDSQGTAEWTKSFLISIPSWYYHSIVATNDGGYVISLSNTVILKLDANGDIVWEKEFDLGDYSEVTRVILTSSNQLIVTGYDSPSSTFLGSKIFVSKLDTNGNELWLKIYNEFVPSFPYDIAELTDGNFAIVGSSSNNSQNEYGYLMKVDTNGNKLWRQNYDYHSGLEVFFTVNELPGKNLIISGETSNGVVSSARDVLLIKTDSLGYLYTHLLTGNVFYDQNLNCLSEMEPAFPNLIVKAEGAQTFFTTTDSLGNYQVLVDTGSYELTVIPVVYWESCQASYQVEVNTFYDSTLLNIPLQAKINCPLMQVDISTPFLRLCNQGYYSVSYCNQGTIPAENATVQITLAAGLQYLSATAPLLSQNGQVLLFDIGTVSVNECGAFQVLFSTGCAPSLMGQTLCTEAHIFPDSLCGNTWTGPNLAITGACVNDTVRFNITNEGGDMPVPLPYIVIEDNIILMTNDFQLGAGGETTVDVPAQSGSTYHIAAWQAEGFPGILGNTIATASVENCVGNVNSGAFSQWPEDDGEPWLSIDCHPVIASYDPNDKTAFPGGWTAEHYILDDTELDYLIRFQNTGTDTAFLVVLVDTISAYLNPGTIRPGAGSHPYTFELSGQGVAKFIFKDILLPDSTTNEAASHGWVKFRIAQQPGNAPGTVIENTAAIYFDYNAPVLTNTTFHKIHEILVTSVHAVIPGSQILAYPNPFSSQVTFSLDGVSADNGMFSLFDAWGKAVYRQRFKGSVLVFQPNGLPPGIYFFRIENDGKIIGTGKLIAR